MDIPEQLQLLHKLLSKELVILNQRNFMMKLNIVRKEKNRKRYSDLLTETDCAVSIIETAIMDRNPHRGFVYLCLLHKFVKEIEALVERDYPQFENRFLR